MLTTQEAAKYDEIRRAVMAELPPAKSNVVKEAIGKLRTIREQQGLSLADMQARTGMTRANLCRLENEGRNVTLRTLERYSSGLGCKVVVEVIPATVTKKKRKRTA
jgi:DNA-binding Xre family transcriptional regulator